MKHFQTDVQMDENEFYDALSSISTTLRWWKAVYNGNLFMVWQLLPPTSLFILCHLIGYTVISAQFPLFVVPPHWKCLGTEVLMRGPQLQYLWRKQREKSTTHPLKWSEYLLHNCYLHKKYYKSGICWYLTFPGKKLKVRSTNTCPFPPYFQFNEAVL